MKRSSMIVTTLALIAINVLLAHAQQIRNAQERVQDKKGAAAAMAGVADDRRDVDRLSDLVMRWDHWRQSGNDAAAQRVQQQIAEELRRDLKETTVQARQAEKEVKQSTAEVSRSNREVRRERRDGDGDKSALRDDRRDRRDDRADRRDDMRDAKKVEEILKRKREIAVELVTLQKRIDAAGKLGDKVLQAQQSKLLDEYLALSREEIQLGIREAAEDMRELREDRRETREDRRN